MVGRRTFFDDETLRLMGVAYDALLNGSAHTTHYNVSDRELVARAVLEVAAAGERDLSQMIERAHRLLAIRARLPDHADSG